MSYDQKLQDPRWKEKRRLIIERDGLKCTKCKTRDNLQVHHLAYLAGADPWQVPDDFLQTLCDRCHATEEKFKREITKLIRELSLSGYTYEEIFNQLSIL